MRARGRPATYVPERHRSIHGENMKKKVLAGLVLTAALPLLAACTSGDDAAASPATVTVTSQPPAAAPNAVVATPAPSSTVAAPAPSTPIAAPVVDFPMPDMTGQVLQDAQDGLQARGLMYSVSHDALGSRHQVLDRDWKVCGQNVAAGQHVTSALEGKIDFAAVKLSETCP